MSSLREDPLQGVQARYACRRRLQRARRLADSACRPLRPVLEAVPHILPPAVITIDIAPKTLDSGAPRDVIVRVANIGIRACHVIRAEIDAGLGIAMVGGDPIIDIPELAPGEVHDHLIRLRPHTPGIHRIAFPNFSYRDRGIPRRPQLAPINLAVTARDADDARPSRPRSDHPTSTVPTVFISHRRAESRHFVERLHETLVAALPRSHIFMDKRDIRGGDDFLKDINVALSRSQALLALIGPQWVSVAHPDGSRRITVDIDVVRHEIRTALARSILVIPVLFNDAKMPTPDDLPEDLRKLAGLSEMVVSERTFSSDVEKIVRRLASRGLR